MSEQVWQPIETAPKDGTSILVAAPGGVVTEASWSSRDNGWFDAYGLREDPWEGNKLHPTHWMPLPEPPPALAAPARPE